MKPAKLVVLDRDGTLIKHVPYLSDPDGVEVLPGVQDGLRMLRSHGIKLAIHTNQSGIGRGWFSMEQAIACNQRMYEMLQLSATDFIAECIAPEAPDAEMINRKPSPAFVRRLMQEHGLTPDEVFYVGDSLADLQTANNAGANAVGVNTGKVKLTKADVLNSLKVEYPVFDSFLEAVLHIVSNNEQN